MNIREMIKRMKLVLDEMAYERKQAIRIMDGLVYTYSQHICKVIAWRDNEEWSKVWIDEIYNYINQIGSITLKGGNRLKEKDYLDNFFNAYLEMETEFASFYKKTIQFYIKKEEYPTPTNINIILAYANYRIFVDKIMKLIISDDISYSDVINLCEKYLRGV